jgi:hypothetical protein
MADEQQALRIRVVQFFEMHKDHPLKVTVDHFTLEGIPRRTIYNIKQ